jgi:hypothetical protein
MGCVWHVPIAPALVVFMPLRHAHLRVTQYAVPARFVMLLDFCHPLVAMVTQQLTTIYHAAAQVLVPRMDIARHLEYV